MQFDKDWHQQMPTFVATTGATLVRLFINVFNYF